MSFGTYVEISWFAEYIPSLGYDSGTTLHLSITPITLTSMTVRPPRLRYIANVLPASRMLQATKLNLGIRDNDIGSFVHKEITQRHSRSSSQIWCQVCGNWEDNKYGVYFLPVWTCKTALSIVEIHHASILVIIIYQKLSPNPGKQDKCVVHTKLTRRHLRSHSDA